MKSCVLGIDTSAYTTSIAAADADTGSIIWDSRRVLRVPVGQKGLRQQEAVFQHLNNLAQLIGECTLDFRCIRGISVSSRPRNVEGSYMPVFTVGVNYARVLSKALSVPLFEYSHQENHIAAAFMDFYKTMPRDTKSLSVHMSGGTSEFLLTSKAESGYNAVIAGGTKDITFGQLIDRMGILMDFPFPCGVHMDRDVSVDTKQVKLPKISGREYINLSGMENYFRDIYVSGRLDKYEISSLLFRYISMCTVHIINCIRESEEFEIVAVTGGVSANSTVRRFLTEKLSNNYTLMFPKPGMSSDNAVGNACLPTIDRWYNEA